MMRHAIVLLLLLVLPVWAGYAQPDAGKNRAGAYYNFAMGRMYAELAGNTTNRGEYLTKAIEHYRAALKLDPGASYVFEEMTDLLIQAGRLRDAVTEAEEALARNPDNLEARRILARIYSHMVGEGAQGKISEDMLRRATEQYQKVIVKDPQDVESWVALGRLHRQANNSVEAEKAFNAALKIDANNEDALTGLAVMYSDLGDTKRAIEKLRVVTDRNPSPQMLAALATAYEQSREYKSAAEVLAKALEQAPESARLKRALARDLFLSEQYDAALEAYVSLIKDEPKDLEIPLRIGEIYRAKREFSKSREWLDKARKLDPGNIEVRYDDVNLLEAEGQTEQAIAALRKLLGDTTRRQYAAAEAANRVMLLERLGILYRSAGQYPQAVETFRQIPGVDAEAGARVAAQVIDTYRLAKDYKTALQEADAAVKQYPEERMAKLMRASVLGEMGRVDEAAAAIRSTAKSGEERETQLSLAQLYDKAKRFDEMGKALDEAEKLSTSDEDKEAVFFMRGAMYERMKKFDASEAEFRKVLAHNPDHPGALNYLGYMFADRDVRLEEAYKLISRALELDPQNGAYLDSLGWVYYRQGRLAEAETALVRALERIGKDPTVHDHLGDVYLKLGKTREAIGQWQASLKDYESGASADTGPEEMAQITRKLENARVKLAQETGAK
jgi:tetratricopeptide (TPR) repeat protein